MYLLTDRFNDTMDDLRVHGGKQYSYHVHALANMMQFQSVMSNQEQSIQGENGEETGLGLGL